MSGKADKSPSMKILRMLLTTLILLVSGAAGPAHAQVLFRSWHLKMSEIQARSRISTLKGERVHDAQGGLRVRGVIATREGSEPSPEELFFDVDMTTTLLRGTEYDPDFLRTVTAAGYRHRRTDYMIELYGEHVRRMNTDRAGRRNVNFFGVAIADPEFEKMRFGARSRVHGRVAGGGLVNEHGFNSDARYLVAVRYDYKEFPGRPGKFPLPKGQIFLEAQADAMNGPGGLMTDMEAGVRFLFFPDADNSLSIAAKVYDSKNPLGHGDDGVRIDLDLDGSHTGELFTYFLGNTAGEFAMGGRGEDIATELVADFDLVRIPGRGRNYLVVFDSLQRATWGKLNKIEYNLQGGVETPLDEKSADAGRRLSGLMAGLYFDHRSTHGMDRVLPEKNYNIIRLALKTPGWDPGRENETRRRIAAHVSAGNYIENSFKKSRDWDGRAGIRVDGANRKWGTWDLVPYGKATLRNATNHGRKTEVTGEMGVRFNLNAVFARWSQDAYFGEGGFCGLALRF